MLIMPSRSPCRRCVKPSYSIHSWMSELFFTNPEMCITATDPHLNGVLHKSLASACICVLLLPLLDKSSVWYSLPTIARQQICKDVLAAMRIVGDVVFCWITVVLKDFFCYPILFANYTSTFITIKLLDFVHRPDFYKQKTQRFGNWICFRLQARGGTYSTEIPIACLSTGCQNKRRSTTGNKGTISTWPQEESMGCNKRIQCEKFGGGEKREEQ
jgi:hypothetical protein